MSLTQSDPGGQQQSQAPAEAGLAYIRPSRATAPARALRPSSKHCGTPGLAVEHVFVLTKKCGRGQHPGLLPHTRALQLSSSGRTWAPVPPLALTPGPMLGTSPGTVLPRRPLAWILQH